jgi:hypothetical protein
MFNKVFRYIHLAAAVLSVIVAPMCAYSGEYLEALFFLTTGIINGRSYYTEYITNNRGAQ